MDKPQFDRDKFERLDALAKTFIESLRSLGVREHVLAVILPVSDGAEIRTNINGNSEGVVNLISGLIQNIQPGDFEVIFELMQTSPLFELQRPGVKKQMVN